MHVYRYKHVVFVYSIYLILMMVYEIMITSYGIFGLAVIRPKNLPNKKINVNNSPGFVFISLF